jgi:hypothetical protein
MSGGNDAPPTPDYGPLIAASSENAKYAFELGKKQQAWAEKIYYENKGVSDLVIDKALGMMDRQDQWAQQDRARYENLFQPLEEQLAAEAQDFASPERQEHDAGKAEADVAAQFEEARRSAMANLEQFGIDPSQVRAGAMDAGSRYAEAAAQASAGNQARDRTMREGWALRDAAINVGKGYPAQVQGEVAGSGQSGNQAVNTGLATTASGAQTQGTGMSWQQAGNQGLGVWGNLLNTQFGNQMDAWKAEQESSSGIGGVLGSIAGLATAFVEEGGAIPEPTQMFANGGGPIPVEASPSGGAIPDDIDGEIAASDGGPPMPAKLNAGEFVFPKDVMAWNGEQWAQKEILKARKAMAGGEQRPAQPEVKPEQAPPPYESVGAIPTPEMA